MIFVFQTLSLIGLYLAAAYGAWELAIPPYYASVFWPSAGVAFAFVYLYGYRMLPGVFIGSLLSVFLSPLGNGLDTASLIVAFSLGAGSCLQVFAGVFFVRRAVGENTQFENLRAVTLFSAIGILSCLIAASVAAVVFLLVGRIPLSGVLEFWEPWFIGDFLGVIVVSPLLVLVLRHKYVSLERQLVIIVPVLLLFAVTVLLFFNIKNRDYEQRQDSFVKNVQLVQRGMKAQFDSYLSDVYAIKSFYDASTIVDKQEFKRFVQYALEKDDGIQAFAWTPLVNHDEKDDFLEEARSHYGQDYFIKSFAEDGFEPVLDQPYYMPVHYVAPPKPSVMGFDVWSDALRREAISRARDGNMITSTEPVILASMREQTDAGFIVVAPVYQKSHLENGSVVHNRDMFLGTILGAFQYGDAVRDIIQAWRGRGIELKMKAMLDGEMVSVFDSQKGIHESAFIDGFMVEMPYEFAGQQWVFCFYMNPSFYNQNLNISIWYALIAALIFLYFTSAFLMIFTGQAVAMKGMIADKTAELSHKNKFLNIIMDTVPDMIFVKDHDLNIVQANQSFFDKIAPDKRDSIVGTKGVEDFPEDEQAIYLLNDKKTLREGFSEVEETITDYLGVSRTMLTKKFRFYDENDKPFLLGYARDVTDLLSVQRKLETILDTTADGLITIREDGVVETYNKACEVIFGYEADEVIGNNISMLMPEEHAKKHGSYIDRYFKTGNKTVVDKRREFEGKRKDGSLVPVDIAVGEVALGSRKIFSGVVRDISEKKKAEEVSLQIAQIFSSSIIEFYIFDAETFEFLFVNEGAIKNMGYSEDELLGYKPSDFVDGYVDDKFYGMAAQLLSGDADGFDFDMRHTRKDGSVYDVAVNIQLTVFNGRPAFIASMLDITDRNVVTDELKRSNKELESFAYVTSHDLKAPLRHVSMSASFFQEKFADQLDGKEQQLLDVMISGTTRMQNMIESLLEYSRVGREDSQMEDVDLNDVISAVQQNLINDINQSDSVIEVDDLPVIFADRYLLIQLFQNLIQNSIKYKKESLAPRIRISMKQSEGLVHISVADNGIGVDPSYADKIFQIFQRLHRDNEYEGVGIGLSICQRIVEFHGGRIALDKEYKNGTKIDFTLAESK